MSDSEAEPTDTMRAERKRIARDRLANLEHRSRHTGNVLYVWIAIWEAHAHGLPMPEWCYGQLVEWAYRVHSLAHGLDPDREFERQPGESEEAFGLRLHDRYQLRKPELDFNAARKAAQKMFSAGSTKNLFRDIFTDEQNIREYGLSQMIKFAPPQFAERLKQARPAGDDSDSKKRITRGRKLSRGN